MTSIFLLFTPMKKPTRRVILLNSIIFYYILLFGIRLVIRIWMISRKRLRATAVGGLGDVTSIRCGRCSAVAGQAAGGLGDVNSIRCGRGSAVALQTVAVAGSGCAVLVVDGWAGGLRC